MSLNFTSNENTDKEESLQHDLIIENSGPEINLEAENKNPQNPRKKKIDKKKSEDKKACTYTFTDENHTLGNFLRFLLIKDPRVAFAGYSIVHPAEDLMKLRVQSVEGDTDEVVLAALEGMEFMAEEMLRHLE